MIGDTASISLLTGLPGSGKSLRLAQAISTLVEEGKHVYHCNINGLNIAGTTPWDDPLNWRDLPAGAILFVDEAQQYFRARRGGEPPEYISAMETIRHLGVRLVLATQQPNYLDTHLRGLVGFHEHLLRQNGKDAAFIFRNNTVIEEVRAPLKRIKTLYDYENWKHPKKYFACYKSAELHTVKYSMPAIVKKALMILPVVVILGVFAFFTVFRDTHIGKRVLGGDPASETAAGPPSEAGSHPEVWQPGATTEQGAAAPSRATSSDPRQIKTAADYAVAFTPLVDGLPWSAPAYLHRPVVAEPELFCISSVGGLDASGEQRPASCHCRTEQGSRYDMPAHVCEVVASSGQPYNPYKQPTRYQPQEQPYQVSGPAREPSTAFQGTVQAGGPMTAGKPAGGWEMAAYGDFGRQTGHYVGQGVGR